MADSETIALLKSIDLSLKSLVAIARAKADARAAASSNGDKRVATDAELDGPHGDPEVRAKNPRDFVGPSMVGRRFSECPPEYLDLVADRFDYFATRQEDNEDGRKKAHYNKLDAARARGWALRIRFGKHTPKQQDDDDGFQGGF